MKLYSIAVSSLMLAATTSFLTTQKETTKEQYIVFAKSSAKANELVSNSGAKVEEQLSFINGVVANLSEQQLAELREQPGVRISRNTAVTIASSSDNDDAEEMELEAVVAEQVYASELHEDGLTGQNVTVAVLDTGIKSFPALTQDSQNNTRLIGSFDVFDEQFKTEITDQNGHGTHIASIISNSQTDDDGQYFGIAPDVSLVGIKAFDANGAGTYADVIKGIHWAVENKDALNIRVINMSFSAPAQSYYWDDPVNLAVMQAWEAGIVVIASSGNRGSETPSIGVPGNVPYVITVGAATDRDTPDDMRDDWVSAYSSVGPTVEGFAKPEVISYGGHVPGLLDANSDLAISYPEFHLEGNYYEMTGTSQSTAVVAGIAALMISKDPSLTPDQVSMPVHSLKPKIQRWKLPLYSHKERAW